MKEQDYTDPALEEIWAIREKIAAEFDHDVQKMAKFHMEYEKQFGDRVIPPPERKKPERPAA
ncbi:MAG TPA: hypothetical protein VEX86_26820 [Longimicrobium sp.]|nr:hypothetical protein [Longimicrobium sp.]